MRENDRQRPLPQAEADGIIEGRNAVIEALRSGENIDKIYLAKGETDKTLGHIASRAREKGIVVVEADQVVVAHQEDGNINTRIFKVNSGK